MDALIIGCLWILLVDVLLLLAGVFLAIPRTLRYIGLPIPPQVDKFGLLIIALLALIWFVTLVIGGGETMAWLHIVIGGGSPMAGLHIPR